jgi:hypothetical protein
MVAAAVSASRRGNTAPARDDAAPPALPLPRACRVRLVFRDPQLERSYRDHADARLLAGGHDLTAGFVLLGVYAASTVYVLHFAGMLDGAFLRTCRPLLGAGLALSLINMLVVAQLSRAQAGARRRRQQLERRLLAAGTAGTTTSSSTSNWSSAASTASSRSSASAASASIPTPAQQRRLRSLIAAEAEAELRAARRRGQWCLVARVLDTFPSLFFKPQCISFWDPNWRRAAQSVASDSGAVWLALSAAQRPPASVWLALPWHTAAWLLSALRLAPEVCLKFEASPYHRALVRRVYARLATGAAAVAGAGVAALESAADVAATTDESAGPCSCHLLVNGALFAGGFLLPLWAMWSLERTARRRWLAARGCNGGGGGSAAPSSPSSYSPDLAPLPAPLHLLGLLAALNATWQALQAVGAPACRATVAALSTAAAADGA